MDTEELTKNLKSETGRTQQIHRLFVKHVIGFNAGRSGIISSGMVGRFTAIHNVSCRFGHLEKLLCFKDEQNMKVI